jgi:DNA mismatch endonuclease (patch repair protein)
MVDKFSKEKRSEIMSKIRSRSKLDQLAHKILEAYGIPHTMYPKIEGNPDIELKMPDGSRLYLFIDGCFFHMCPIHYRRPQTNQEFWVKHIEIENKARDEARAKLPYHWVRIWEHEIRSGAFTKMAALLAKEYDKKPLYNIVATL